MSLIIAQNQVRRFHEVTDGLIGTSPHMGTAPSRQMRYALINEEAHETLDSIYEGDFPAAVDGLCDLIYVCLGAAVTWGVDLDPCFGLVHRSNMLKAGGPHRADGKILKPEGWVPPNIREELLRQGWKP